MVGRPQFRLLFCVLIVLCVSTVVHAQAPAAVAPPASAPLPASPKITYSNGQLTISALDVSLGDVLRAVSVKTGAVIEFPADRAQEHLFANAGPGPVREVLATLLNGSRFNYVMLASPTNPGILQRMILTTSDEPANASVANQPIQAAVQMPVVNAPPAPGPAVLIAPSVAIESQQLEAEAPSQPLSPDAVAEMMKARREARKLQREQEAGSTPAQ
jgi:hypothetical protein